MVSSSDRGPDEDEARVSEDDEVPLELDPAWTATFKQWYAQVYEEVRKKSSADTFDVKLVALAESLKIRVISKGPALKYFLLKPVQKYLSQMLGRFPAFRLTRETVSAKFLDSFFQKRYVSDQDVWHSLDYQSATDLLNPELSLAVVDSLVELLGIPEDIGRDFRLALTGHTIEGEPQRWGQLMGSVVSFIVLCIVNLTVIRFSYELCVGRRVPLHRLPALVNGDDGLVRAPPGFLDIWKDVAKVAGLIPSVGKVYTHPTYVNINSTSYEWSVEKRSFTPIPYVNMGLVYGYQRSTTKKDPSQLADDVDERVGTVGARHRALITSCPFHLRVPVHKAFLRLNSDLLKLFGNIPWYVEEEWGGVGLHPITDPDWDGDIDTPQYLFGPKPWEVLAREELRDHPRLHRLRHMPHDAPIQVRSTWTNLIPYRNVTGKTTSYNMSEGDIGLLDVSTYYVVPSLVARAMKSQRLPVLHANQRAWRRLQRRFDRPLSVVPLVSTLTHPDPLDS
jgi:hypothetical protein